MMQKALLISILIAIGAPAWGSSPTSTPTLPRISIAQFQPSALPPEKSVGTTTFVIDTLPTTSETHPAYVIVDTKGSWWHRAIFDDPDNAVVMFFTIVLGIAAVAQGFILFRQDKKLKTSIDDARENSKRQLRAYVGLIGIEIEMPYPELEVEGDEKVIPFKVYSDFIWVKIKNAGQTPAKNVRAFQGTCISPFGRGLDDNFDFPIVGAPIDNAKMTISSLTLLPGETHEARFTIINRKYWLAATRREKTMILYGEIQYLDIYGDPQVTEYCFTYEPWREDRKFIPYDIHNNAT